jgi:hypothetical protein
MLQALQLRPGQMLCYTCNRRLASVLPEPTATADDVERNVRYWKGVCFECGQLATIARFVPPEEPEEPQTKAATQG